MVKPKYKKQATKDNEKKVHKLIDPNGNECAVCVPDYQLQRMLKEGWKRKAAAKFE